MRPIPIAMSEYPEKSKNIWNVYAIIAIHVPSTPSDGAGIFKQGIGDRRHGVCDQHLFRKSAYKLACAGGEADR